MTDSDESRDRFASQCYSLGVLNGQQVDRLWELGLRHVAPNERVVPVDGGPTLKEVQALWNEAKSVVGPMATVSSDESELTVDVKSPTELMQEIGTSAWFGEGLCLIEAYRHGSVWHPTFRWVLPPRYRSLDGAMICGVEVTIGEGEPCMVFDLGKRTADG